MFAGAATDTLTDRQRFVINGVINAVLWNFPSTPLMIMKSLQTDEIFTRPHQLISTTTHILTNTVNVFRARKSALLSIKLVKRTYCGLQVLCSTANSNVFSCQIPLCCSPFVRRWPLSSSGVRIRYAYWSWLIFIWIDRVNWQSLIMWGMHG